MTVSLAHRYPHVYRGFARKRCYQGRRVGIAMVTAAVLSVALLILSGLVPEPLGTPLAYASFASLAYAVHVAVRRWRVRTIGGA